MTLQITWTTEENQFEGTGVVVNETVFHALEFDAVMSETHEGRSEMTEHAVESGAVLSDHKRNLNRTLTLEGLVTNTPLDAPPASGFAQVNVSTSISKENGAPSVKVFSTEFNRVRDVWDTLERLRVEAIPVSISTEWRDYEDVQILSVTLPRNTPEDAATFAIEISEIRIANSREIDTPAPREPRGTRETDRGSREGEDATARGSVLDSVRDRMEGGESLLDAVAGTFGLGGT